MRSLLILGGLLAGAPALAAESIHELKVTSIDGEEIALSRYRGKVLLVVNTASRCGYTRQYAELEQLHRRYADRGLAVLGFPCNDFGGQEPGSEAEIKAFCTDRFQVSFPMFSKVHVRGEQASPLYRHLTRAAGEVRWNFTKFLVDHEGRVVRQFQSAVAPLGEELIGAIEGSLSRLPAPAAAPPASDEHGRRPSPSDGGLRLADYVPLRADRSYTYTKRIRGALGRDRTETLRRQPRWLDRDGARVLRVEDSEGEYQDFALEADAPALAGQSMLAQGFEQQYDPPIALLPSRARLGETRTFVSQVKHRTRRGIQLGRLERQVTLEVIEDVTTPAGTFRGCLRLRVVSRNTPDLEGRFLATSEETIWLAPGLGEVRSLNRTTLSTAGVPWMRATIELELERLAELL